MFEPAGRRGWKPFTIYTQELFKIGPEPTSTPLHPKKFKELNFELSSSLTSRPAFKNFVWI